MRRARRIAIGAVLLGGLGSHARAQSGPFAPPPLVRRFPSPPSTAPVAPTAPASSPPEQPGTDFRGRFGVEMAMRLLRSSDADDRLRGLARAAAVGTPEAVALLVQSLEPSGAARSDARATIEVARGLSAFVDQQSARAALGAIVGALPPSPRAGTSGARLTFSSAVIDGMR